MAVEFAVELYDLLPTEVRKYSARTGLYDVTPCTLSTFDGGLQQ